MILPQWILDVLAAGIVFGIASPLPAQSGNPLTLPDAIAAALQHHPSLDAAKASEDQAKALLRQSRAALLPSLSIEEDALYSDDPVFAFGSKLRQGRFTQSDFSLDSLNNPSALSNFSASGTATWIAFDGGTTRDKIKSAAANVDAAKWQTRYTAEELAAQVTTLFYRVLTAEDQVTVAISAVKRASEIDDSVADRVRSGLSLESDGARAHLAFSNARDDLAQAQDNVRLARYDLFAAMGTASIDQTLVRNDSQVEDSPSFGPPPAADTVHRFDIVALDSQALAARHNLGAIRATEWPQISTFAHAENDAQYFVTNGSGNWTIGAKVQFTVFDGGARRSREQEAASQIILVEARKRSTLLAANSSIAALQAEIENLKRRLSSANNTVNVQQEALKTARDRYGSGLLTLTDVLNSDHDLASAEFARVRTYYQLRIAYANLALATGSPLSKKAGQP